MELLDAAFHLLKGMSLILRANYILPWGFLNCHEHGSIEVHATTDITEASKDVNIAIMLGGFPRKEGMERKDMMFKNVPIHKEQALAMEEHAASDCKVTP